MATPCQFVVHLHSRHSKKDMVVPELNIVVLPNECGRLWTVIRQPTKSCASIHDCISLTEAAPTSMIVVDATVTDSNLICCWLMLCCLPACQGRVKPMYRLYSIRLSCCIVRKDQSEKSARNQSSGRHDHKGSDSRLAQY